MRESFIKRSGSITFQVDCNETKSDFLHLALDGFTQDGVEQTRNFLRFDFKPRDLAMITHASDFEAEPVHQLFAALNLPQTIKRDFRSIRKSDRNHKRDFEAASMDNPFRKSSRACFPAS